MNLPKQIITFGIVVVLLFFVFSNTYFNIPSAPGDFGVSEIELGYHHIEIDGERIYKIGLPSDTVFQGGNFYVDRLSEIDSIYFEGADYSKTVQGNTTTFEIGEGLYVFDVYDFSKEFIVQHDAFEIFPKSPGKFLIDTSIAGTIQIFSFDALIDVQLGERDAGTALTSLTLYPHILWKWRLDRLGLFKGADLLKISNLSEIVYVGDNFLNKSGSINQDFIKKIYSNPDRMRQDFFKILASDIYNNGKQLHSIQELSYQNLSFPEEQRFTKYFLFVLNKNKKSLYYQYQILSQIHVFFTLQDDNITYINARSQILDGLASLKDIDEQSYEKMKKIVLYVYGELLKTDSIDYLENAFILGGILLDVNHIRNPLFTNATLYLYKIYFIVDSGKKSSDFLQQNLLTFLEKMGTEERIVLNGKYNDKLVSASSYSEDLISSLQSLSYFLKNILLDNISFSDIENVENILAILNTYTSINNSLSTYASSTSSGKETLIVEYYDIVSGVVSQIREVFFEPQRSPNGLLILNQSNRLSIQQVDSLNNTLKVFFGFYREYFSSISPKNVHYHTKYDTLQTQYLEYYSALSNYHEYSKRDMRENTGFF